MFEREQREMKIKLDYKYGRESLANKNLKLFKSDYLSTSSSWTLQPNDFLYHILQNFILEIHQHGFMIHFESLYNPHTLPKPEETEPKILTLQILSAGFIVWLFTIIMACFSFFFEISVFHFLKRRELTKNLVTNLKGFRKKNATKK